MFLVLLRTNGHAEPTQGAIIKLFDTADAAHEEAMKLVAQYPANRYYIGQLTHEARQKDQPFEIVELT